MDWRKLLRETLATMQRREKLTQKEFEEEIDRICQGIETHTGKRIGTLSMEEIYKEIRRLLE